MFERFFIIGAQRSGTTYLYQQLAQHPEIEMAAPVRPEPKFFLTDAMYAQGLAFYDAHFFSNKPGAWLRGEKSASYYETEISAMRLARHFPTAKILCVLRDPVARAISNYWFSVANHTEGLPLEEAFLTEEARRDNFDPTQISVSPYSYLRRGRYIDYLLMYERYFAHPQIQVILYEEMVSRVEVVRQIYEFLNVDPDFISPTLKRILNSVPKEPIALSETLQAYLDDYFAEPNERLAHYLGRDLAVVWPSVVRQPDRQNR